MATNMEVEGDMSAHRDDMSAFLRYLVVLARAKRGLLLLALAGAFLALAGSLVIPQRHQAVAKYIPTEGAAALLGAVNGYKTEVHGGDSKRVSNYYAALLKSNDASQWVLMRFMSSNDETKKRMFEWVSIEFDTEVIVSPEGVISISVSDLNPRRAVDLANLYGEAASHLARRTMMAQVENRKARYESLSAQAKNEMDATLEELRRLLKLMGSSAYDEGFNRLVNLIAIEHAGLMAKRLSLMLVEREGLGGVESVQELKSEIAEAKSRLNELMIRVGNQKDAAPGLKAQFLAKMKEYLVKEEIYGFYLAQLGHVDLGAVRESKVLIPIEKAILVDEKLGAFKHVLPALGGAFAMLVLGALLVLVSEFWRSVLAMPEYSGFRDELRQAWKWRQ